MLKPQEQLKVMTVKGLHHVDTQSMDAATYMTPKVQPGMPWPSYVHRNVVKQ